MSHRSSLAWARLNHPDAQQFNRQRFFQLAAGVLAAACVGIVSCFPIISNKLKMTYDGSNTQSEVAQISTAGAVASYMMLPFGILFDTFGPKPVLFFCGVVCVGGFVLLSLVFSGHIPFSLTLMCVVNAMINLGAGSMDTGSLLSNLYAFPLNRGEIIIMQKTFMGLGATFFSIVFECFFSDVKTVTDPDTGSTHVVDDSDYTAYAQFMAVFVATTLTVATAVTQLPSYHQTSIQKLRHFRARERRVLAAIAEAEKEEERQEEANKKLRRLRNGQTPRADGENHNNNHNEALVWHQREERILAAANAAEEEYTNEWRNEINHSFTRCHEPKLIDRRRIAFGLTCLWLLLVFYTAISFLNSYLELSSGLKIGLGASAFVLLLSFFLMLVPCNMPSFFDFTFLPSLTFDVEQFRIERGYGGGASARTSARTGSSAKRDSYAGPEFVVGDGSDGEIGDPAGGGVHADDVRGNAGVVGGGGYYFRSQYHTANTNQYFSHGSGSTGNHFPSVAASHSPSSVYQSQAGFQAPYHHHDFSSDVHGHFGSFEDPTLHGYPTQQPPSSRGPYGAATGYSGVASTGGSILGDVPPTSRISLANGNGGGGANAYHRVGSILSHGSAPHFPSGAASASVVAAGGAGRVVGDSTMASSSGGYYVDHNQNKANNAYSPEIRSTAVGKHNQTAPTAAATNTNTNTNTVSSRTFVTSGSGRGTHFNPNATTATGSRYSTATRESMGGASELADDNDGETHPNEFVTSNNNMHVREAQMMSSATETLPKTPMANASIIDDQNANNNNNNNNEREADVGALFDLGERTFGSANDYVRSPIAPTTDESVNGGENTEEDERSTLRSGRSGLLSSAHPSLPSAASSTATSSGVSGTAVIMHRPVISSNRSIGDHFHSRPDPISPLVGISIAKTRLGKSDDEAEKSANDQRRQNRDRQHVSPRGRYQSLPPAAAASTALNSNSNRNGGVYADTNTAFLSQPASSAVFVETPTPESSSGGNFAKLYDEEAEREFKLRQLADAHNERSGLLMARDSIKVGGSFGVKGSSNIGVGGSDGSAFTTSVALANSQHSSKNNRLSSIVSGRGAPQISSALTAANVRAASFLAEKHLRESRGGTAKTTRNSGDDRVGDHAGHGDVRTVLRPSSKAYSLPPDNTAEHSSASERHRLLSNDESTPQGSFAPPRRPKRKGFIKAALEGEMGFVSVNVIANPAALHTPFSHNLLRSPFLLCFWWIHFAVWGTGLVCVNNLTQIYTAVNDGSYDSRTNALHVSIMGIGGAIGRVVVGYGEMWVRKRKATREALRSIKLRETGLAPETEPAVDHEPLSSITVFLAIPALIMMATAFFLTFVPAWALGMVFAANAFAFGASWSLFSLAAREIFSRDIGKNYNFCFTSGIVAALLLNYEMFGKWYDVEAERQREQWARGTALYDGEAPLTCSGNECIRNSMIVLGFLCFTAVFVSAFTSYWWLRRKREYIVPS